jgi:hypothetical protein
MHILESVAEKHQGSCMSETKDGSYCVSVFLKLDTVKERNATHAGNYCL